MINKNMKKCSFILFFIGSCMMIQAQHNEEVTVVAPFSPSIPDIQKIAVVPHTQDTLIPKAEMKYDIYRRKVKTNYEMDKIKPAKVAGEPISKLYPFFVKAGFGNYTTPYAELFAHNLRSKNWSYGAHLKHLSSNNVELKDYTTIPANFSNNEIDLFGKKYFRLATIGAAVSYNRDVVNCYGIKDENKSWYPTNHADYEDLAKRKYNEFTSSLFLKSNEIHPDHLFYLLDLKYNYLQLNTLDTFFQPGKRAMYDYHVGLDLRYPFSIEKDDLSFLFGVSTYLDVIDQVERNQYIFNFTPYTHFHVDFLNFKVGARMNFWQDWSQTDDNKPTISINPFAEVRAVLIPEVLTAYLGLDGGVEKNTLNSIRKENPFLNNLNPEHIHFTHNKYQINVGVMTRLAKQLDLKVSGFTKKVEGALNFDNHDMGLSGLSDSNFYPYHDFDYMFEDYHWSNVTMEMIYHYLDKWQFTTKLAYDQYDHPVLYKPNLTLQLMLRYQLDQKIALQTEFYLYDKMKAHDLQGNEVSLDMIYDFNLHAEYRYNKRLSFFLDLNNLLAQRYFNWYQYPSYRFNMMLGASFAF